jgi:1-aminocyclopropane-1-carboxylate deaminase
MKNKSFHSRIPVHGLVQECILPDTPDYRIKVLREDLVHPFTGGNKWRKLKYNLIDFREQNKKVLLTFGGAFSNHLIAVASAGRQLDFDTIGIVRGENIENPCLHFMKENGMKLFHISREEYRRKDDPEFISVLLLKLSEAGFIKNVADVFILPEGGANAAAVEGAAEIANDIPDAENIFCACGTGATVAGLSRGIKSGQHIHAIPVLRSENFMAGNIVSLGGNLSSVTIHHEYHFGGYAKKTGELEKFCHDFFLLNQIEIEPVYTGKMFFAIKDLLNKETFFSPGSITAIHTGGVYSF